MTYGRNGALHMKKNSENDPVIYRENGTDTWDKMVSEKKTSLRSR